MTIAEIANLSHVSSRTVRRVVAELFPDKLRNGKRTDFNREEASAVVEALRKTGFVSPLEAGQNAEAPRQNAQVLPFDLSAIIRETVAAVMREMVPAVIEAVKASLPAQTTPLSLPPPPDLEPRDALRKIVGDYAAKHDRDFRGAWMNLSREFELRAHRNIRQCAKNRGMDTLDYCEGENILGELLALAYCLYAQKSEAVA